MNSFFQAALISCSKCDLSELLPLINRIIQFLLTDIVVPVGIVSIAIAGMIYIMAGGNESKVKQAHDIFYYTVVGLLWAIAAFLVVKAILLGLATSTYGLK